MSSRDYCPIPGVSRNNPGGSTSASYTYPWIVQSLPELFTSMPSSHAIAAFGHQTTTQKANSASHKSKRHKSKRPHIPIDFFKDDSDLKGAPLGAFHPSGSTSAAGQIFDRLGNLMQWFEAKLGIETALAIAVWMNETGGKAQVAGETIIRFENHHLFSLWGKSNPDTYDKYFQHGGRAGVSGKPWTNHRHRMSEALTWSTFHGQQDHEYSVLGHATQLAGTQISYECISMGGCQILGSEATHIGYANAKEMFDAFDSSERWQVLGFFDFCKSKGLIAKLKGKDFKGFGDGYNGGGQPEYIENLRNNYETAKEFIALQQARTGSKGL